MNIELPNGFVVQDVPDGITDEQIKIEAIKNGWAKESDFPQVEFVDGFVQNGNSETTPELPAGTESPQSAQLRTSRSNAQRQRSTQVPPEPMSFGDEIIGALEAGATMVSGALAPIPAGIYGMTQALNPFADKSQISGDMEAIQKSATYDPRTEDGKAKIEAIGGSELLQTIGKAMESAERSLGDAGYDVAGPLGGAIGATIPTAVMEALGLRAPAGIAKLTSKVGEQQAVEAGRIKDEINELKNPQTSVLEPGEIKSIPAGKIATEEGMAKTAEEVAKAVKDPSTSQVKDMIKPDGRVMKAARDMGFDEIPVGVATTDPQMRGISMGLTSITGSKMGAQFEQFSKKLIEDADKIIIEGGGKIDKAEISDKFRGKSLESVSRIKNQERRLYGGIEKKIGKSTNVNPSTIRELIDEEIPGFGSFDELPKELRSLGSLVYSQVNGELVPVNPRYGKFTHALNELGEALGGKMGTFSKLETGLLKRSYSAAKTAHKSIAKEYGIDKALGVADALTVKRKLIENNLVDILGRKLEKDLMPAVGTKLKGVPTRGVTGFVALMEKVPKKMRQEVVVSALNNIMKGSGADQVALGVANLTKFISEINRTPTSRRAIYMHLPKKTQIALDNLSILGEATYKANKKAITTGKIAEFFPDQSGYIKKMVRGTASAIIGATVGAKTGGLGFHAAAQTTERVFELLDNATAPAKLANELMAGKSFQEMIKSAINDSVKKGANIANQADLSAKTRKFEQMTMKSVKYKSWAKQLEQSEKAKIASLGLVVYLLSGNEE